MKASPPESVTLHEHHGQEFIYVLDGEVELVTRVGEEEIVEPLRPGDSVFLESSVPHLLRGRSRNPYAETSAQVIVVFWNPLGESYLFGQLSSERASQPKVGERKLPAVGTTRLLKPRAARGPRGELRESSRAPRALLGPAGPARP